MSSLKDSFLSIILIVLVILPVAAQVEAMDVSGNRVKVIQSKDIPLDTLAMDMEGVKRMEVLESTDPIHDNNLPVVAVGEKKVYDLKDIEIALNTTAFG